MQHFTDTQERRINEYFCLSVFLKGLVSVLEIIGGVLALFIPVPTLTGFITNLFAGELAEEPTDFIASHLVAWAHQLAFAGGTFISLYLLSRGLIKLVLVIALLKNQLWAYPASLVVLGLFVLYQGYQIIATHSGVLVALTVFDLVVMWFIWREWEVLRAHLLAQNPAQ